MRNPLLLNSSFSIAKFTELGADHTISSILKIEISVALLIDSIALIGFPKEIETRKLEGIKIRSRASWLEEGERPMKFFSIEKCKQERACITKLWIDQGVVTTDKNILAEAQTFYQQLYSHESGDSDLQHELLELLERQLSEETKESCEGPITEAEMTTARKKMHMNKSPGPDSLTTEFYHTFWNAFTPDLLEVYNDNFLRGKRSNSQQEALLRLLHKKNE